MRYILVFCIIIYSQLTFGQSKLVNVDFDKANIDQVITDLENKTGYIFYYDAAVFDSLRVTLTANQQTFESILNSAFKNTDFRFVVTQRHEVFLTKGRAVQTKLANYFNFHGKPNQQVTVQNYATDEKERVITEATTETKMYEIGVRTSNIKGNATIAGYVKNVKSGEPIIGASLFVTDINTGVVTDQFGFYSITMPVGKHVIVIKSIDSKDTRRQITLYSDGKLNIELREQIQTLREVKISADKVANIKSTQLGVARLTIKNIKEIPAIFGEADVLRAVLVLPGVQSVGEATTGFNVRGGSADQNLIMLDGSTIYNPAHFFGFFSAFNPDIVKDVELYKSTIPEKFGGRLSSVLDVTDREGNKKNFTGSAGLGILTSRLSVEGPIVKDKTSFLFGGRTTYSNWLLKLLPDAYKNSQASFYDFNLDISHQINDKNNLYIYTYVSNDRFKLNSDTSYSYSNKNFAIKWKHNFNNKLYGVMSAGFDRYQYQTESDINPINAYNLKFNINQSNFRADFNYYPNTRHTITWGLNSIYYKLNPGTFVGVGSQSLVSNDIIQGQQALESALYAGDKFEVTNNLSVSGGLRYSLYNFLGPGTVNNYTPGLPIETGNLGGTTIYKNNALIKTYRGPEIRASARYSITDNFSIKASYNTLRQYIHLLSNTTAISPTDIYQLSDPNIKPQYGDQVSFGLFENNKSNTIETSVEVYYKRIKDYLDYKSGATLVLNHHIETDVVNTEGKAYGIEFLVRKTAGKLTGLMSYTYSRTFLRQDDPLTLPLINKGNYYPANYDKPHDFNLTGSYHFSHRYSLSFNFVYSTGRPITLPVSTYYYGGGPRVYYTDRNEYRIPDYFRSDFSVNLEGNHRVNQRFHNSWTFGVYNVSGRANAYSTYFTQEAGVIKGYKLSIFATAIPFLNYNIRF